MRGRSSSDWEKCFHRTGIPSANVLRKAGLASGGPLIRIQPIPRKNSTSQRHFPRNGHLFPGRDYFSDLPGTDLCLQAVQSLANLLVGNERNSRSNMGTASGPSEASRRLTRVRLEIPLRLATLSPAPIFAEESHTLVVNPQGCGVKLSRALDPGTRVLLDGLPGGLQATARVANCLPLGTDGRFFLLGLALENPGNVWGIKSPPEDWGAIEQATAPAATVEGPFKKKNWPYSLFSQKGEAHPGRR